jgi:hypothetical protein
MPEADTGNARHVETGGQRFFSANAGGRIIRYNYFRNRYPFNTNDGGLYALNPADSTWRLVRKR